ncbi:siderophore-interacting protein [Microbacterium oxydans]|nr:siderophore-interacting protein [Microbacterium oxydans]
MTAVAPAPVEYVDFPVRIREVEVVRTTRLSDTMIRLTFGGSGAEGFESAIFDEHVKLIFPEPDTGELRLPRPDGDELIWPRPIPTSREYTIRAHRPDLREIDIDFVVHASGLASDWARDARPGDRVHVAGPPGDIASATTTTSTCSSPTRPRFRRSPAGWRRVRARERGLS